MKTETALLIIDMQMEMQRRIDAGRPHVHPAAPQRIGALATAFRAAGLPVIHVRHAADDPASPLHPDRPGYPAMPCTIALPGEAVFVKTTSSAFASTGMAAHLRERSITDLYVVGAVVGFCVNSTVRAGADLGFRMVVVRDAVIGFDLPSAGLDAQTIFDVTMGLLEADFAILSDSDAVIGDMASGLVHP